MGAGLQKMLKNFFQSTWKTKSAKPNKSELYTDDNKPKCSSNPMDISKSAKIFYQINYTKEATSEAGATKFLSYTPDRNKI